MNAENCKVGIEYFDNLGRPEQSIGYRIAVGGGNIVGYYEYDGLGRQSKNYLPYNASGENQDFRTNAKTEQLNYYNNNKPYTEVNFDNSPYNRVNSATGVGTDMTGILIIGVLLAKIMFKDKHTVWVWLQFRLLRTETE